jgi:hypothetical protein
MQLGYYEFANHGDLFLLGAIGLFIVARNWWDIIRYGLRRHATATAWLVEPAGAAGHTVPARLAGVVRRLRRRGKAKSRRPGRHA